MSKLDFALNNLNADISVLRHYVQINQSVGMTNMLSLLEAMCVPLFEVSYGHNLVNKNQLSPNFPAIDLADDRQGIAIQVTSNATTKKVNHTLKKFAELNEKREKSQPREEPYSKLFIFSLLKSTTSVKIPKHCQLVSFEEIVNEVKNKHSEKKVQVIINAVQEHVDYSRLHPYTDASCLEIILGCIDRNAIKHRMLQEGSHYDMIRGLNEITELISKGTVNGERKSKDVERFDDPTTKQYLREIRHDIGEIVAIANVACAGSGFGCIPNELYERINEIKAKIRETANVAATHKSINITLEAI